tara:strand:+ start:256 stop:480 length:225 start_codon:yes stop_codon:yes gene_type:complete
MSLFINNENISAQIEDFVKNNGGEYIDAVLYVCEENEIEPKAAVKYLTKPIIEKIEVEGIDMNLLPKKSSKLPV